MPKEILCAFGVDVDAVAGWLGSYGGEDSPDDISRGLFGGEAGRPQVLLMLERLIEHINSHEGIRWATFDEIADDYAARFPRQENA